MRFHPHPGAAAAVLAFVLVLSCPAIGAAQPSTPWHGYQSFGVAPPARLVHEGPEARHWYGWQILIVDVVSTMLVPVAGIGVGSYALGGPIVHWAHGETGRGFGSLAMRVLSPTLLGLAGSAVMCSNDGCDGDMGGLAAAVGFLFGAAVGAVSAIVVDSAVLGYEPVDRSQAGPPSNPPARPSPAWGRAM